MAIKLKNVMLRAWAIARKAAKKFGDTKSVYFAQSLKQAWLEAKNVAKLVALGGDEWFAGANKLTTDIIRVYFNDDAVKALDVNNKDKNRCYGDFYFDVVKNEWSFQAQRFFEKTGVKI